MRPTCQRALRALAAVLVSITALLVPVARAHDIPASVVVHAWFKASDGALDAIVRVPLKALRDVEFPRRAGVYLDLATAGPALDEAVARWLPEAFAVRAGEQVLGAPRVLALRASLPSERVYEDWAGALAHVTGAPLPPGTEIAWEQVELDVLLRYDGVPAGAALSVEPSLARFGLRVTAFLRHATPSGAVRAWELHADPGWMPLDPGVAQVARRFTVDGIAHVLDGADHLLFVLCLVIPLRRLRPLVVVVTAFTLAHSLSLAAAAYGVLPVGPWTAALVETLIAASIVWMALENIVAGANLSRRWIVAFAFGLVHGVGFSLALRDSAQFAGDHLLGALLAFNVGVEVGQVAALAVFVPACALVFGRLLPGRVGVAIACALIAHTGWHWMLERAEPLRTMPALSAGRAAP